MLKKIIILFFVICFSLSSMSFASESLIFQGREFRITETMHMGSEDFNKVVTEQFGSGWEVADWVEIKQLFGQSLENANILADFLTERAASPFVSVNGNKFWSGTRLYFISPHYHSLPSGWAPHDNIQNYMVSLGSWPPQKKILAVRDQQSDQSYTLTGIMVNGLPKSVLINKENIHKLNTGDRILFIGKGLPNTSYSVGIDDPILRSCNSSIYQTDNDGYFYYPKEFYQQGHKLPEDGTFIFRFSNGQVGIITTKDIAMLGKNGIIPDKMVYREIGPLVTDLSGISAESYMAIRHLQMVQNGETIPNYTDEQLAMIRRGDQQNADWAIKSFIEELEYLKDKNKYISWSIKGGACSFGVAASFIFSPVTLLGCVPLSLAITETLGDRIIDRISDTSSDISTYLKMGNTFGFFVVGGLKKLDAPDFLLSLAIAQVKLRKVTPRYIDDSEYRYLDTTWIYKSEDGLEYEVEMLIYATNTSEEDATKIFNAAEELYPGWFYPTGLPVFTYNEYEYQMIYRYYEPENIFLLTYNDVVYYYYNGRYTSWGTVDEWLTWLDSR